MRGPPGLQGVAGPRGAQVSVLLILGIFIGVSCLHCWRQMILHLLLLANRPLKAYSYKHVPHAPLLNRVDTKKLEALYYSLKLLGSFTAPR